MDSESRMDPWLLLGQPPDPVPSIGVHPRHDQIRNTGPPRLLKQQGCPACQRLEIQVAVGINHLAFLRDVWRIFTTQVHDCPMSTFSPDISIIVPVLNDAAELAGLLENLAGQRGTCFELIVCDGGSHDHTCHLIATEAPRLPFRLRLVESRRGRGAQMNAGAAAAGAEILLFLHADSRVEESDGITVALMAFRAFGYGIPVAARFRLRFRRSSAAASRSYFYHEAKARLNRADCIRGDQGYMIRRQDFELLGRYDEALPYLEDVRLAHAVEKHGGWLLLPATLDTSARRFEQEGFRERQIASAIIINAFTTGWNELLTSLPELYHCGPSGTLDLEALLGGVTRMLKSGDPAWRRRFWRATGRHLAANAWQFFFWIDVRSAYLRGHSPDRVGQRWLGLYQRLLQGTCSSYPAGVIAELLARLWFWQLIFKETRRTG